MVVDVASPEFAPPEFILPDFTLPAELEAHDPPEARGLARDGVRMLVSRRSSGEIGHHGFRDLPSLLLPGDLLVVNTTATLPAAVRAADGLAVHFSTPRPDGAWLVELRQIKDKISAPNGPGFPGQLISLPSGAVLTLEGKATARLWRARLSVAVVPYLLRHGLPIRYSYVGRDWALPYYQTVFAREPGSAEMPSASRPFTPSVVTALVALGVLIAPLVLHTGVSSLEAGEDPYPEPYDVPPVTAGLVNHVRANGGRIIAAGTTVVRALETAALETPALAPGPERRGAPGGRVAASAGWTSHVVTPETGVTVVDGLLTGLHEPRSSHLRMLAAFAGPELLSQCYDAAVRSRYLWHEFGDVHLLLPLPGSGSLAPAMKTPRTSLLITLTGRDRPGVTSRLFAILAGHPLSVLDVEQVVIRGRLVLGVLLGCDSAPDLTRIHAAVSALATDLGLEAEITTGSSAAADPPARGGRLHVTLLGSPLAPAAITAIAGRIAASGANIDRIGRLAQQPVTCIEMEVSGGNPETLRTELARAAVDQGIDVAVQRGGLHRRALRLIVMDVDSTLIQDEVIDLLAARAGCAAQVAKVTAAAMRGELDFTASLRERVSLLAGLEVEVLEDVRAELRLTAGAQTLIGTLAGLGYKSGIVSGGFIQVIGPLAADLGIDYVAANELQIGAGKLTGRLCGPVIDRAGKAEALRRFAGDAGVPLSQTVAVGDGANDLDMIAAAGLGVAFNAKPLVRDAADTSVSVPYLDAILYLLGISSDDVAAGS